VVDGWNANPSIGWETSPGGTFTTNASFVPFWTPGSATSPAYADASPGDPGGGIGDWSCEKCHHSNFDKAWTKHPPEGAGDLLCDDGVIETHAEKCILDLGGATRVPADGGPPMPLGQCRGKPYDCNIDSLFTCRPTYGGDYRPAVWTVIAPRAPRGG
jgi:hypothetical protein